MRAADERRRDMKVIDRSINQTPPDLKEIRAWLEREMKSIITSYRESDGVIRDARAGRDLMCASHLYLMLKPVQPKAPCPWTRTGAHYWSVTGNGCCSECGRRMPRGRKR